jgi:hypothetical protein
MNISDELERLDKPGKDGNLGKNEFAPANSKLQSAQDVVKPPPQPNYGPPDPAKWDFSVQMVILLLVVVLFSIFLLLMWPHMHNWYWNG